jgi:nucleoid-associated protein YgaU
MEQGKRITPETAEPRGEKPRKRPRFVRILLGIALAAIVVVPAAAALAFLVVLPAMRLAQDPAATKKPAAEAAAQPDGSAKKKESAAKPAALAVKREDSLELLRHDEAYWTARLELGKQPKFALAVDLVDSVAYLDVRGVPVRTCRILDIETSRAFPFMFQHRDFRERMAKPIQIKSESATILKEPIRVTFAPKDSIEAEKAAATPVEPDTGDVFFDLHFDGGLVLAVSQSEPAASKGFRRNFTDRVRSGYEQAKVAARSLFRKELPRHELRIEVTMSREDAKAIYRALGPHAKVALRL